MMPTREDQSLLHRIDARVPQPSMDPAKSKLILAALGMTELPVGEAALKTIIAALRSVDDAQAAAVTAIDSLSPPLAYAVQATENAWLRIEHEYGMSTSREVADELGSTNKSPSQYAASRLKQGKLIVIRRRNAILHPGSQLRDGEILPAPISWLIKTAKKLDLPLDELTQWLCAPNDAFGDDKPVNHLNDPDELLETLHHDFNTQWQAHLLTHSRPTSEPLLLDRRSTPAHEQRLRQESQHLQPWLRETVSIRFP